MSPTSTSTGSDNPVLYHIPRTISSPLVQIILELGNPGNITISEISFNDLKQPEYLSINPMGTSPAFHDSRDEITLWESGAILDYLLERYDTKYQLHVRPIVSTINPSRRDGRMSRRRHTTNSNIIKKRAKYLQLKQYIIATVYPFVASMYLHTLKDIDEQDAIYLRNAREKWRTVIGPVLSQLIDADGPYYFGNQVTAIDYLVMKPLTNIRDLDLLQQFPKLQALFDQISRRPTYDIAYRKGMLLPYQHSVMKQNHHDDHHKSIITSGQENANFILDHNWQPRKLDTSTFRDKPMIHEKNHDFTNSCLTKWIRYPWSLYRQRRLTRKESLYKQPKQIIFY